VTDDFLGLPIRSEDGDINVVVETPKGAPVKYAYDAKVKAFTISKSLLIGLTFPSDFGFVPSTRAEDGDPLDVLVLHDAPTFPGIVLPCRVIGVLATKQKEGAKVFRNDRIIAVPVASHRAAVYATVKDLPKELKEELERFFRASDELQDKTLTFLGWRGPSAAKPLIKQAERAYRQARRGDR
jgi:inorganic pyrophosphatase